MFLEIVLFDNSSRTIEFNIRDIPPGDPIAKGIFVIKSNLSDSDGMAIVTKRTDIVGQGSVVANGATFPYIATVRFEIDNDDANGLSPNRTYYSSVKIILSSGRAITPPNGRGKVTLQPSGITAVS